MYSCTYIFFIHTGKPFHDSTFSRNQLTAWIDIRKGKVIHQWSRRLCVISGTRLLIYKGKRLSVAYVNITYIR